MVGVTNIQINESKAELETLLQKSQNLRDKERLQVLYLLKSKQLKVKEAAQVVGKHRGTIHRWLSKYSQGGIDALLSFKYSPGRKSQLPLWAMKA
jgi:transposase